MIDRLEYLARTLSRTKRKDYENYVINAVWNRLDAKTRLKLKPVAQQTIRTPTGNLYYIDLYFPQLNLAVECDEIFHTRQLAADRMREASIRKALAPGEIDVFSTITAVAERDCEVIRIPVPAPERGFRSDDDRSAVHRALTVTKIDEHIDACVAEILRRAASLGDHAWADLDALRSPETYYASRQNITVRDGVVFDSIAQICNVLLGTRYKPGRMRSYFTPATLRRTRGTSLDLSQVKVWCPKNLAAAGRIRTWTNELSSTGEEISERQTGGRDRDEDVSSDSHPRLTFVRVKDEVTGERGLRFAGVFTYHRTEGDTVVYRRTCDEFQLPEDARS